MLLWRNKKKNVTKALFVCKCLLNNGCTVNAKSLLFYFIFFLLYNKKLSKLKMTFQHQPFSVLKVLDFADGNSSFVIKASSWMNSDAATD